MPPFRPLRCGTVDGQRNFPEEQESRWFPEQREYAEPDWRNPADDRYPSDDYRASDPRGGTGDEGRYGGRNTPEDEPYGDPLAGVPGFASRHGESRVHRTGEIGRETDPGYGGRPAPSGLPPQGSSAVASGASIGDPGPVSAGPGAVGDLGDRPDHPSPSMDATGSMPPVAADQDRFPYFGTEPIDRPAPRRPPGQGGPASDGVYRSRRPTTTVLIAALTIVFEIPALRLLLAGAVAHPVSASGIVAGTLLVLGLPIFAIGLRALVAGPGTPPDPGAFWLRPPTAYLTLGLVLLLAAALAA